jgi:hypothetical protein
LQVVQAPPLVPQALAEVPGWHLLAPSQQPLQVLAGQVPPQPSLSPLHLFWQ